jgi:hypothetical protein
MRKLFCFIPPGNADGADHYGLLRILIPIGGLLMYRPKSLFYLNRLRHLRSINIFNTFVATKQDVFTLWDFSVNYSEKKRRKA